MPRPPTIPDSEPPPLVAALPSCCVGASSLAAGSVLSSTDNYHCFRPDPAVQWREIADILASSLSAWDWALANIERWLARGNLHPAPLREWQRLIRAAHDSDSAKESFLASLRLPPADAWQDQLRSCAPFIGGPFQEHCAPPG